MDDRRLMMQNAGIWEPADASDQELIKKLYVTEQAGGLRAIRIVGTYLGLIFIIVCLQLGTREALAAAAVVALLNIGLRWYTRHDARGFSGSAVYTTQGVCVKKELVTERERSSDGTHMTTHYYATFEIKDGSQYCLDLNDPYFRKLSLDDVFVFARSRSGQGGFNYYSQREIDELREARASGSEEIESDWLAAEGWHEANTVMRPKLLAACKIPKGVDGAWLFGGAVCIVFTLFYTYVAWPLDNTHSVTTVLVLLMTFGLIGVSLLWSSFHSYIENIRMAIGPVYYMNGKCTEITHGGVSESIAHIELQNGLKFILPLSERNRVHVGSIRCVNTRSAYRYKNKFIGKHKKFDPDWYEKQLFFIKQGSSR